MSSRNDSEKQPVPQGVYSNEEDWQSLLKRLPSDWQDQAIGLGAWQRCKLACIGDLLPALLVYAACGYSFREVGLWATLVGIRPLSERAWRKRVERAQHWIEWLLEALIGSQQTPDWLPQAAGRILLLDGSCLKTPAGSGEDVKMHTAYNFRTGRLEFSGGGRSAQWGRIASGGIAPRRCDRDRCGLSSGSQCVPRQRQGALGSIV